MNKPIAIVTGGAGFIGSHMVDLLINRGFHVRVIDSLTGGRKENLEQHKHTADLEFFHEDIRNIPTESPIFKDAQYVFHFAGIGDIVPSIEKPLEYMSVNIQGTAQMLECARHAGIRKFVYAASSSCYGLADVPTTEEHAIDPQYPYALSKYQGEQAVFHWHKVYGLPVNSIRIFNAYGTRSRTSGAYGAVFGVFLKQKLEGVPLTVVGDGSQSRDFIYVTDIAEAFFKAAESEISGEIFNVGSDNPQSINRLVELLDSEAVFIPKRPGEPDCTWADISKIRTVLDWQPEISFTDGVKIILENIDYWRQAPLWDKDSISSATETWFKYL